MARQSLPGSLFSTSWRQLAMIVLSTLIFVDCHGDTFNKLVVRQVRFATAGQSAHESSGTVTITAELLQEATVERAVPVQLLGDAEVDTDFTVDGDTFVFAPGQQTASITLTLIDDLASEANEIIALSFLPPATVEVTEPGSHIITLIDNDTLPALSIDDPMTPETAGDMIFTVTLSQPAGQPVTVDFATEAITATATADYTSRRGTLTFNPGQTTQTIAVPIVADSGPVEGSETLRMLLSNPTHATIADNEGIGTILDVQTIPEVSIDDPMGSELDEVVTFTVTLSEQTGLEVTVDYATIALADEATPGTDYQEASGTVTFAPGSVSQTVSIAVIDDVEQDEGSETFALDLSNPVNATLLDNRGIGTILDDDLTPAISINDPFASEEAGVIDFTVTLSQQSGAAVSVNWVTVQGDGVNAAVDGTDYTGGTGTLEIAPGITEILLSIPVIPNFVLDGNLTFTVVLDADSAVNATVLKATGIGTILDDEIIPTIDVDSPTAVTEGGAIVFTVSLSEMTGMEVQVDYATVADTAEPGEDYVAGAGTLVFAPGESFKMVTISTVDDDFSEVVETFFFDLDAVHNAILGVVPGVGTINDDDDFPAVRFVTSTTTTTETSAIIDIPVELSAISGADVTATITPDLTNSTALRGVDFNFVVGPSVTIPAWSPSANVRIEILDDALFEVDEVLILNITAAIPALVGTPAQHIVTIQGNDPIAIPEVQFTSTTSATVEAPATTALITVQLSAVSGANTVVTIVPDALHSTATQGADLSFAVGPSILIPAGDLSADIEVSIVDDLVFEVDEMLILNVTGATNANLGANTQHTLTILGNDATATPTVEFAAATSNVVEAPDTTALITVQLSEASGAATEVTIVVNAGGSTATTPADFTYGVGPTVTIPAGDTSANIEIHIVDDSLFEIDETLALTITAAPNAILGTTLDHVLTIATNDVSATPNVDFALASSIVDEAPSAGALVRVQLSAVSGANTVVTIAPDTQNSTAHGPADFSYAVGPSVTIPAGATFANIEVDIVDDALFEVDETLILDLTAAVNSNVGTNITRHVLTIQTNDPGATPDVNFAATTSSVTEGAAARATITVQLSEVSGADTAVTVTPDLAGSTAAFNTDYTYVSGPDLIIPAGDLSADIEVATTNNNRFEVDETLILNITAAVNANIIMPVSHTLTIVDDDASAMPNVGFAVAASSANESSGTALITVQLNTVSGADTVVTISETLASIQAEDYAYVTGPSVTVPKGSLSTDIEINIVNDSLLEAAESLVLTIDSATNATTTGINQHILTIPANDNASVPDVYFELATSSVNEPDSGTATVDIHVMLSRTSGIDTDVTVALAGSSTAIEASDFMFVTGPSVSIPATQTQATIQVSVAADLLYELAETIVLEITSAPDANVVAPFRHTLTIAANDAAAIPNVSFAAATSNSAEAATTVGITVALSIPSGTDTLVTITPDSGSSTAVETADFNYAVGPSVTILAGNLSTTIDLDILDDALYEVDETLVFDITAAPHAVVVAPTQHTFTILANDAGAIPNVSFATGTSTVAEAAATTAFISVELDAVSGADTLVTIVADAASSAATPADFTYLVGPSVTIPAGALAVNIEIAIVDDALFEVDESLILDITGATGATFIGTTAHIMTIPTNDPSARPDVSFLAATSTVAEAAATTASITVDLSAISGADTVVTITRNAATSTAALTQDYTFATGPSVTIGAGSLTADITVNIVDDLLYELDETLVLDITAAPNATVIAPSTHTLTIGANDAAARPTVAFAAATSTSSESALGAVQVSVSLSTQSGANTVLTIVENGSSTATLGTDFNYVTGPNLTIPAGSLSANITLNMVQNLIYEGNETLIWDITTAPTATLGTPAQHTLTIADDETPPTVSFTAASSSAAENAGTITVTLTQSMVTAATTSIVYSASGTATGSGTDYTIQAGSASPLSIPPGATGATIRIDINDDVVDVDDDNETIILTLGTLTNATAAAPTVHTVTIIDNDAPFEIVQAETGDANGNGYIDFYAVTFSNPVIDASFDASLWRVTGHSSLAIGDPLGIDIPGDAIIYITFAPFAPPVPFDTGELPDLYTTAVAAIQDGANSDLAIVTAAAVIEVDGAPPVIGKATTENTPPFVATSQLYIIFSEPVTDSGGGNLVAADIAYVNDASRANDAVQDLGTLLDADGSDGRITYDSLGSVIFTGGPDGDIYADALEPGGSADIVDAVGLSIAARTVTITGFTHPSVASVSSIDGATVEIVFSEPVDNSVAGDYTTYGFTDSGCNIDMEALTGPALSPGVPDIAAATINDRTYRFTTTAQDPNCWYTMTANDTVVDLDEGALLINPKSGSFQGDQQLRVVSAQAVDLRSFLVAFSKPVYYNTGDGAGRSAHDTSLYTITPAGSLGLMVQARRYSELTGDPADDNKVLVNHSLEQSGSQYTIEVTTTLETDPLGETLADSPFNRTFFQGFGATINSVDDGAMFIDPFGDGTTFSFVFAHQGKVYAGPNDTDDAVFRFDPDGFNGETATFQITASNGGPYDTFAGQVRSDGVDAFVSANVSGSDFLVFGVHAGSGNLDDVYFTQDTDNVLDIGYCNISDLTIGNTETLQMIYGYGNRLYMGFADDGASGRPLMGYVELLPGGGCAVPGNNDFVTVPASGNQSQAHYINRIGAGAPVPNTAPVIGIDSMLAFDPAGAPPVRLFIANNGSVSSTPDLPLSNASTWTANGYDGAPFAGTTARIPDVGRRRPGEKGYPWMTQWGDYLFVGRNRRDDNSAEVWRYDGTTWARTFWSGNISGFIHTDVSLLTVNGAHLYIGFDHDDGARLYRSDVTDPVDLGAASEGDFTWVGGIPGFGPATSTDLDKNKHIISDVSASYAGSNYLYITVGCQYDLDRGILDPTVPDGPCDRDRGSGTDFAIRMFRQVD